MLNDNLSQLRKLHKLTQEDIAEQLGCTRQTVSKWETGESIPDLEQSRRLASLFGVSLDDLVDYDSAGTNLMIPPKGKHVFGCVTVGEKGQIVIPARARKIFHIQPGDSLIVLGDESQGLALLKTADFLHIAEIIRKKMAE